MVKYIKKWWNTPSRYPKTLATCGFAVASWGIYTIYQVIKNPTSL